MRFLRRIALLIGASVYSLTAMAATPALQQCLDLSSAGDFPRAVAAGRAAVRQEPRNGLAQECLASGYLSVGDVTRAWTAYRTAESLYQGKEDLLNVYGPLGHLASFRGDLTQAQLYYSRQLSLARDLDKRAVEASAYGNLANVMNDRGDMAKAIEYNEKALGLATSEADKATTLNNLALIYNSQGDYAKAIDALRRSIKMSESVGKAASTAHAQLNLGAALKYAGEYAEAETELMRGLAMVRRVGDRRWEAIGLRYEGDLLLARGQIDAARQPYLDGLALARANGDTQEVEELVFALSRVDREATATSFATIEIGSKGVKAAAVTRKRNEKNEWVYITDLRKNVNTDVIKGVAESGEMTSDAIDTTALAVRDLFNEIRDKQPKAAQNLTVAASSAVAQAINRDDLAARIKELTGVEPRFITAADELRYAIAAVTPGQSSEQVVLLDIGSGNGRIGYVSRAADQRVSTVMVEIPKGTVSMTELIQEKRMPGEGFAAAADRVVEEEVGRRYADQIKGYPAIARKRVFVLVGGAAWAMTTLTKPEDQSAYVKLSMADIRDFYARLVADPAKIMSPDLSRIADPKARDAAAKNVADVNKVFTPDNLVAAARLLKMVADYTPIGGTQQVWFAREGSWAYGLATLSAVAKK